jgi:hypothetical protein
LVLLSPERGEASRIRQHHLSLRREKQMKKKSSDVVEAEVMLRPADPTADSTQAVNAASVHRFEAKPETVEKVVKRLRDLGFKVTAQSTTSISIAGPSALFEQVFKAKTGDDAADAEDDAVSVPAEIKNHVSGVYIQRPPTYFKT